MQATVCSGGRRVGGQENGPYMMGPLMRSNKSRYCKNERIKEVC